MRKSENRSIKSAFSGLLALVVAAGLAAGCGLKANPVPPGLVLPPAVTDLAVVVTPAGNRLMWSMPPMPATPKGPVEIARIRIYRSDLLIAGESCPGCPREFKPAANPTPRDLAREEGARNYQYVDTGVKPGLLYTYTIRLCDSSDFCGAESNKAEVKFRDPGPGPSR